jgi:hypothetical protein
MWEKTTDTIIANYHMNGFRRRINANAYYSPSVDRFFAVDSYDPYTALEVAQILSSKMPGISVCILQATDVTMDNNNCINYTIEEKNLTVGPANILYGRQTPTLSKIPLGVNIVKLVDTPHEDFNNNERYQLFLKFHEYAKFTIQCWHAIKLTDAVQNILPTETYADDLIDVPEGMNVPADSTNGYLKISVKKYVKQILYTSNSADEVLSRIKQMWIDNDTGAIIPYRRTFYSLLDLVEPAEFTETINVDRLTIGSL